MQSPFVSFFKPLPHVVHTVALLQAVQPYTQSPHYTAPPQLPVFGTGNKPVVQLLQAALKWPDALLIQEVQYGITEEQFIHVLVVAFGNSPVGHLHTI